MKRITISSRGRSVRPRILFSLNGMITINPGGAGIIGLKPGGKFDLFLDDGKKPTLYVRASPSGFYKCHKSDTKINNKTLVNYLISVMDWPVAEDKRKSVWLEISAKECDVMLDGETYANCHKLI